MRIWLYLVIGIVLISTYYFLDWLFWLSILIIGLYVFYRFYRWLEHVMAPPGHRIKHGLLKGHLQQEYGTHEGRRLYKEMVGELRRKGYR